MNVTKLKVLGAVACAVLGTTALSAPAVALQITIHDAAIGPYESATITGGALGAGVSQTEGYTGQQLDHVTFSGDSTVYTLGLWCVDLNHDIVLGSNDTYTLAPLGSVTSAPPVTWTTAEINKITWLAFYGNQQLANYTSADSTAYGTNNQFSAAVQVAIWNTEYGSSYVTGDSTVAADLTALSTLYAAGTDPATGGANFALVDSNNPQTQELDTYLVALNGVPAADLPEPVSLALLGSGLIGFTALRRRRAA